MSSITNNKGAPPITSFARSPKTHRLMPQADIVWPPQTTQDVLNLTPRKNRHTPLSMNPPLSPSPLRRSSHPAQLDSGPSSGSDDDDEETLQLKLAQIQAKLKLKKLQRQRARSLGAAAAASPSKPRAPPMVEVPLSPTARRHLPPAASPQARIQQQQQPASPNSPSRVLLGIDRGLTGKDVSLRRAPQYRKPPPVAVRAPSPPRPTKTFSQRLAEERSRDKSKFDKQQMIAASRSKGFGLASTDGVSTSAAQLATHSFTSVLEKYDNKTSQSVSTSFSAINTGGGRIFRAEDPPPERSSSAPAAQAKEESTDEAGFDSFSGLHLSRRLNPHATVARHLAQKSIYTLPVLLKAIVSPIYDPPDVEGDWVVVAAIASKSDPRNVGAGTGKETGKKYMVFRLTDLKWEVELFLFGAGFERFWKLPVGTVVALLNPGVLKPRAKDSGKFSLTITDDAQDCVLEIGMARDLGFCRSVKRDGKQCSTWVDKRHTHFCAFHVEQTVKKARVSRAEVNSMTSLFSPPKKKGGVKPKKFFGKPKAEGSRDDNPFNDGPIADMPRRMGGAGGNIFVAPGRSTASLLDDDDYLASNFHRGTKEERLHKRIEDGKKERELTKRIIQAQGREGGIGAQYLKTRIGDTAGEKEIQDAAAERDARRQVCFARDIRIRDVNMAGK